MKKTVLSVSCIAQLLVVLDASIMNIAFPSIRDDFDLGDSDMQWVAMAYTLGFAGVILAGARLGDVYGAARVLAWGIGVFTFASVIGGFAGNGEVLIAARAIQGISAAVLSPATFTLLTVTFPEGAERVRAVSVWTGVSLVGGGLGNILGGVLTDLVSWRAVLLINLPIGIMVASGAFALTRKQLHVGQSQIDFIGALLVTCAFTTSAYAISRFESDHDRDEALIAGACSVVLFLVLIIHQRRSTAPLLPSSLWRSRSVVMGNMATFVTGACFQVAVWYYLTFFIQGKLEYSATSTGMAFLPLTLTTLIVNNWITPPLLHFFAARTMVVTGALVSAFGFLIQGMAPVSGYLQTILVPALFIGLGGGLVNTPLATIVTKGISPDDAGAASGLMNTSKQFGGAVGLAGLAAVPAVSAGSQAAFGVMAILMLIAGSISYVIPAESSEENTHRHRSNS